MSVSFYKHEIAEPRFRRRIVKSGVAWLINEHGKTLGNINIVFCSDEELLKMNKEYLQHDYYTDVISFSFSEGSIISGDIYISIDRLRENARKLKISTEIEIRRIVGHGVLHLIGFLDKSASQKKIMTKEEEKFLKFFN